MSSALPPPPSPGVGARRKGPKTLPKLDFTGPNSASSDRFPIPPSPSAVHPQHIIDAHLILGDGGITKWLSESGKEIGQKASGAVVVFKGVDVTDVQERIKESQSASSTVPIIAASVPVDFKEGVPDSVRQLSTPAKPRIHLRTAIVDGSAKEVEGVSWALEQGHTVDVDVQTDISTGDAGWELLEDFVDKASGNPEGRKGFLVLSNILPPPHQMALPIVKLLSDPGYLAYQNHIATISLFSHVYVKFLPPSWGAPTPQASSEESSKDAKEWKRRIKMYLGPAVEAFGYQRIIFGSSPSTDSNVSSNSGDWYALARESITELGLEQEDIDAVFFSNAKSVYGGL